MNDGLLWYMGGPGPGTSTSTRMGMVLGAYGSRWQREYWSSAFVGCAVSESGGGEVLRVGAHCRGFVAAVTLLRERER